MKTLFEEIFIDSGFQANEIIENLSLNSQNKNLLFESNDNSTDFIYKSSDVKKIQSALNELLGCQLRTDGDLGAINSKSKSRQIIRIFQGLAGLVVTGKVDKTTMNKLWKTLNSNRAIVNVPRFFVFNNFKTGTHTIKEEHFNTLCEFKKGLLKSLKNKSIDTVFIKGHTDNTGSEKSNKALSENRALEMSRHLLSAWKCDDRISIDLKSVFIRYSGLGEYHPIPGASNAINRRVEFVLLKMDRSS